MPSQSNTDRPKRLLSLDGGGIRGLLAAEILVRIEAILQELNPQFNCLADYFDFIGGTSTGSILATGLALGMPATYLRNFYYNRAREIFRKRFFFADSGLSTAVNL